MKESELETKQSSTRQISRSRWAGRLSAAAVFLLMALLSVGMNLTPAQAGGLFVTGQDADFHAVEGPNKVGARHILQSAVAYVSNNKANPNILLVTDLRTPNRGSIDSRLGLRAAGFDSFAVAADPDVAENAGALNLKTVDFNNYDVVIVASSHGGSLRQDELNILNKRERDINRYLNNGGGLVVLNECGTATYAGRYGFISDYLPGEVICDLEIEKNFVVSAFGKSIGLTNSDVNGNVAHAAFPLTPGLKAVAINQDPDLSIKPTIITLAGRLPNILDCLDEVKLQCPGSLTLTSRISDFDGQALRVSWSVNGTVVKRQDVAAGGPPTTATTSLTRNYAPGNYTVKLLVSKGGGLVATCTTQVTIADTIAPTFSTCAANRILAADANCQVAIPDLVAEVKAGAGDNCTPAAELTITQTPAAGTLVGLGPVAVVITITDAAGNQTTCTAKINVKDATGPIITTMPANQTLPTNAQCQAALPDVTSGVVATDNCTGSEELTVTQTPAAGTLVGPGTHVIKVTVTDAAGNATVRNVTITVKDTVAPTIITCAPNLRVSGSTGPRPFPMPDLTGQVKTSDNCPGDVTVTQSLPAGTLLKVGYYQVTYTARDAAGNSATCISLVQILPKEVVQVPTTKGCDGLIPDVREIVAPNAPAGATVTQSPAIGSLVGPGVYRVIVTITNADGSVFKFPIDVTISDKEAPKITTCAADRTLTADGNGEAKLPDMTGEVKTTDNCTGAVTVTQWPVAGTVVKVGVHTVTYTARDAAGNTTTCTNTVTVTDTTPPVIIKCAPGRILAANAQCQAAIPNLTSEVTATDNATAASKLVITQIPAAGTLVGPGNYNVVITVTDASGNETTCTARIAVKDITKPVIARCAANRTLTLGADCKVAVPDLTAEVRANSTDNCTAASALVITQSPAAGTLIDAGNTTVTITVADATGNKATCTTVLTAKDSSGPTIARCAAARTLALGANCQVAVPDLTAEVRANSTDNCTAASALTITQSPAAGTLIGAGNTTVTVTVTDAAGNKSTCTTVLTSKDSSGPTIVRCAANRTLALNSNCQVAVPDLTAEVRANVTDNCTPASALTITQSPAAGTLIGAGNTTVTITVTDAAGNKSTCTTVLTGRGASAPVISNASASSTALWPPNHKLHDVAINYNVTSCDPACAVTTKLTVTSNEGDNDSGDGNTTGDFVVVDNHHVQLRAERSGGGTGRIYTITITATDCEGRSTTKTLTVTVAHSGGGVDDDGGDDGGDDDGYPGKPNK